uniref:Uncharacterized protein n=1 Tax=Rhizophora mucronata TaxID=61149 RepID=A0A2P2PV14_RHIMU
MEIKSTPRKSNIRVTNPEFKSIQIAKLKHPVDGQINAKPRSDQSRRGNQEIGNRGKPDRKITSPKIMNLSKDEA